MSALLLPTLSGDPLHLPGEGRSVLQPQCEAATRAYVCLTCRTPLANRCQLDFHLEGGGTHVVARVCRLHGPEAWAPATEAPTS